MAAQDARERHHASAQSAVTLNRLHRIFRAGGNVAARRREQGRYGPLVGSQESEHNEFGEVTQFPSERLVRFPFHLLFYNYEGAANFVQHSLEVRGQQRLFGVDDHVDDDSQGRS